MSSITVYPRVHMFSLDLSIAQGHMPSGSMTASLKALPIKISARRVKRRDVIKSEYEGDAKISLLLDRLREHLNVETHWSISISIPIIVRAHIGLGSSTQILGGVMIACARSIGKEIRANDLFHLGIGHDSNAGLTLLYRPGLVIEYGYEKTTRLEGKILKPDYYQVYEKPSKTVHAIDAFPWYLVIAIPKTGQSLSGSKEQQFYKVTLPESFHSAEKTKQAVHNDILKGIHERNFKKFIRGMTIATRSDVKQAEESIQDRATRQCLKRMHEVLGFSAVSSLGPTLYSFTETHPVSLLPELSSDYQYIVTTFGKASRTT